MKNNREEEIRKAKLLALREKRLKDLKAQKEEKAVIDKRRVNLSVSTRRGEMIRAQRMTNGDVNAKATQHITGEIPVNKSVYNGYNGQQVTPQMLKAARPTKGAVRILPIGGYGEFGIGNNMTAIEYEDEMIILDMGALFASDDYPGINYLTPNIKYIEQNINKVKAIAFSHAHLDHIMACKHLLPRFNNTTPIYGTGFTINMIKKQMSELDDQPEMNYITVDPFKHEIIKVSQNLSIEFVHTLHSIPGNASIIIRTPSGVIVFMGDWRFENDPVYPKFDMERLVDISQKEGIGVLINDSTNIDSPGTHPHSEFTIAENVGKVLDDFPYGRVILSCFSSQILRIQLALEEAHKRGRKVAFAGYSMITNLESALRSRDIKIPKDTIIKMEDITKLPDDRVMIICTGSQGELNAVLNRMVTGAHRFIKIKATDVVVFSSNPIPGNEPHVVATVDGLMREGSSVIQNGKTHIHGIGPLHLSGHAYFDDHVKLVTTLKPRNYLPNHGEYYMLEHNAEMAENVAGIPRQNILVCDDGDVIEFLPDKPIRKAGRIPVGCELYDNSGNQVHDAVVKDRLHISQEGIFMIVLTINKKTGRLVKTPDVVSRAFVYLNDSEELIGKIRHYLRAKTDRISPDDNDLATLKQEIKDDVAHILFDSTGHTPIVIPVINRV
ncbi:ribonuclease J [Candidatus Saccharibacteria bacterium]|nr:ribonuclease J [Candidatus Saccharibacteria bacterium]